MNLELALRADGRLGGHIMQGHVDGVGTIAGVRDDGFARVVTVAADPELLRYVVEKGSIAVDGVSLTVARVDERTLDVSLIPETLERTTLGSAEPGRTVNLEVDIVAKYVEKLVGARAMSTPAREEIRFATVEEALEDIAAGRMVVVVDDEDRENEGDLVMAAEHVTPDAINFMTRQAGGWICLALTPERCDELGLELMAAKNESAYETPFTVTIEAREGVTTGISVHDQAHDDAHRGRPRQGRARHRHAGPRAPAQGASPAACSSAPATPRRASTWRGWRAARRPA